MREVIEYDRTWLKIEETDWPKVIGTICIMPTGRLSEIFTKFLVFEWGDPKIEGVNKLGEFWHIKDARLFAEIKNLQSLEKPKTNRVEVNSSNIVFFDYADSKQTMIVGFKGGAIYHYKEVPREIFNDMRLAESKGSFLNKEIKGTYEFEKVQ